MRVNSRCAGFRRTLSVPPLQELPEAVIQEVATSTNGMIETVNTNGRAAFNELYEKLILVMEPVVHEFLKTPRQGLTVGELNMLACVVQHALVHGYVSQAAPDAVEEKATFIAGRHIAENFIKWTKEEEEKQRQRGGSDGLPS